MFVTIQMCNKGKKEKMGKRRKEELAEMRK
jgi:hypothetical protein